MLKGYSTVAILLSLLPLFSITKAQDAASLGCTRIEGVPSSRTQTSTDINTVALCNLACYEDGYLYSYFSQQSSPPSTCYCSDDNPVQPLNSNDYADVETGACYNGDTAAYTVSVLDTPFNFAGCYSSSDVTGTGTAYTDYKTALDACPLSYITFINTASGYTVYCNDAIPSTSGWYCSPSASFALRQAASQPSGGIPRRKRMLERLEAVRKQTEEAFCPQGLTACKVNHEDAYECIDTQSELESCGGCTIGLYGSVANSTIGTDCTLLPGVKQGASTCASGQCTAYACQDGHKLVGGTCSAF